LRFCTGKEVDEGKPYWVFINHQGKRKAKKVGDKKTAEAIAAKIREKLKLGELKIGEEKKHILFKDYANEWFKKHVKIFCKYSTMKGYEICLNKHILPFFGSTTIDQIRRKDIKEFMFSEGLSPGTVRNIKACLSGIFTSAVEDELVVGNPVARLGKQINKMIKKKDPKRDINPFSREEVQLFLKTAEGYCIKYHPVFLCAVRSGLRESEVIGLQPCDLDFNDRFIEVRRSIVRGRITTPKNGKSRRVDMSLQLADVLRAHLHETKKETLKKGWKEPPQWLFYNDKGEPLDPNNLRKRYFYKCLEKAGLRRIRFHDLRHTFASLLISQGESLAYVRDQLGHHSIQVTVDIYGHLVPGANRDAVDKLDDMPQPNATYPQPEEDKP
jgi:integrase